jgi:hypothetical protein
VAAQKDDKQAKGSKGEKEEKDEKPKRGSGPTATRQQKRREERMKLIEEQVADGTLTIRQMTPEERAANPPKNLNRKKR